MNKLSPIGVFDSGFGGLEILRHITKRLPKYDYVYLADTARAPYGSRSQEIIFKFTKQAVEYLIAEGCSLIILACNTASGEALRRLQQDYIPNNYPDVKVLGVPIPAAEVAAEVTKNKRVGIIATEKTISSRVFVHEIQKLDKAIQVFQNPAPLLVPLIENGEIDSEISRLALQKYISPLLEKNIDTLILGCTHYGIVQKQIREIIGDKVNIIDEGEIVPYKLLSYLNRHSEVESRLSKNSTRKFLTTDMSEMFSSLGKIIYRHKIDPQIINLD